MRPTAAEVLPTPQSLDAAVLAVSLGETVGAVSAELATEMVMRICASDLYEGIFEGRGVRQSFISLLYKVDVQPSIEDE